MLTLHRRNQRLITAPGPGQDGRRQTLTPKLHIVLQQTMGWMEGHLREFAFGDARYGEPDPYYSDFGVTGEARVRLTKALGLNKTFFYIYDFGDGWEHRAKVQKVLPPDPTFRSALCLGGANACSPEDVGGPYVPLRD